MEKDKNLEWTFPEYEERDRGNDWFWALGIIVAAGSATALIFQNYFFSFFLILAGILLATFAVKKPDLVFYELNEKGLQIRDRIFPYENIKSFWVDGKSGKPALFIKSERLFMPVISMPVKPNLAEAVRNLMLLNNVPEEEMKEHVSEKIMEALGF